MRAANFGQVRVGAPLAVDGQSIGLLGGSFNPPHTGHVQITEIALRRLRLDQVWWIVTPGNPLKQNSNLPPLQDRLEACERLLDHPRVRFTGFEQNLGTSFTAATVGYLKQRLPGVNFVWIMGADNLVSFHRWQRWQEIAAQVPIAVIDRPGWRLRALASPAARRLHSAFVTEQRAGLLAQLAPPAWTLISGPLSSLSSTALRTARS